MYYFTILVLNSRVLLMHTDTVKELPGYPVQNSPSGCLPFWGGPVGSGGILYYIVCMGCARRKPWIRLRIPVCFRILSSSLSWVSILSVCCYSIVSISVVITLFPWLGSTYPGSGDGLDGLLFAHLLHSGVVLLLILCHKHLQRPACVHQGKQLLTPMQAGDYKETSSLSADQ